jgi:oxygen-independent coproporphyrinogen III oxidase
MGISEDTEKGGIRVPDVVEQPCGLYPGVETFSPDYDAADYCDWIDQGNGDPLPAPLVLYVQNEASDSATSSATVAHAIEQELRLTGALFDDDRPLKQLICTGAVATDWSDDQLYQLVAVVQASFYINHDSLNNWCACSRAVVPSMERLRLLRVLGFNHLRLVPETSGEGTLPVESLAAALRRAKQLGFDTTILDLFRLRIEPAALQQALTALLPDVQPDRIRVAVPAAGSGESAAPFMASFGYRDMGLGWYLRSGDSWWRARESDRLYWTMLGYGELYNPDVIGVGPGALSSVCDFYGINETSPQAYAAMLDQGTLPIVRGVVLEDADVLRREIIAMIMASSCISISAIENKWGIGFGQFFSSECELLRAFEQNHWLRWEDDRIDIRTRGHRELIEICRVFDGNAGNPLTRMPHPASRPGEAAHGRSGSANLK